MIHDVYFVHLLMSCCVIIKISISFHRPSPPQRVVYGVSLPGAVGKEHMAQ